MYKPAADRVATEVIFDWCFGQLPFGYRSLGLRHYTSATHLSSATMSVCERRPRIVEQASSLYSRKMEPPNSERNSPQNDVTTDL